MVQAGQAVHFTCGFGRGCGLSSHCSMTKTRTADERLRLLHLPRQVPRVAVPPPSRARPRNGVCGFI
jgi:hypothetical protein